ncbi:transcription initiation factor TFIID subunit 7 [Diplogelasinospora grovesii]|uniref:Transcription initiation factor TFIID subunit 7 n=1 Tax=Diplogelasinospora grovesii TaxID=303347 RepID=A0AAN6NGF2_9PEZI|nr:transcription initiation factor TFIID subunit 7 [Diplogelasinospora grovesii]
MSQPPAQPKKKLTLKLNNINTNGSTSFSASTPSAVTPGRGPLSAVSPSPQTPSTGPPKIKLTLSRKSQPPTPADLVPPSLMPPPPPPHATDEAIAAGPTAPKIVKSKAGRVMKPSAKKRARTESFDDDNVPLANGLSSSQEPKRKQPKITLKTPTVSKPPTLKVKQVGRIPPRPLGEGYDSEAEDRELDPVIEEQFLLRMMPGEHCEYLQKAVAERKIGVPKHLGGADVQMKFLDEEGRRIMFIIQGQPYAAILLDLPTITEGMKTWDKKAMVKSADICQMLLVFAKVKNEEEAKTAPLPKAVEHGHRWPHGITPPMHDARNRRFRKRLSKLEIQNKEAEVERLLTADKDAVSTKYEFVDERATLAPAAEEEDEMEYEEEEEEEEEADAEGEVDDYFGGGDAAEAETQRQPGDGGLFDDVDDALLEAEFMDAVETPLPEGGELVATRGEAGGTTPGGATQTGTPAAQQTEEEEGGGGGAGAEEDESGDEEEDDDEEEEGEEGADDGDDEDRHDEVAGVRIEIANLKKQLASYEAQYAEMTMAIMKKRIENSIKNIKSEIKLKQSSIGEVEED